MTELVWINGRVGPLSAATVGIEDRGYQFADGVYEVIRVYGGVGFTLAEHLDRLERSAAGIRLPLPMDRRAIAGHIRSLIDESGLREGMVYLQLTRGASPRNHIFPQNAAPTLLFYTRGLPPVSPPGSGPGVRLHPVADERWKRCWIKAIALLPNVLAKNEAADAGCDEAVFVDDGWVSECSASNVYAVIDGAVHTCPAGTKVLPGITRQVVLREAGRLGVPVVERAMTVQQAMTAAEVFITSTTREVAWVTEWGGRRVGEGVCGPVTRRLHEAVRKAVVAQTGSGATAAA